MPYTTQDKLVIAIASSALYGLIESNEVFRQGAPIGYREYHEQNQAIPLGRGVAFPFVRRFLQLNHRFPEQCPVECAPSKNGGDYPPYW